MIARFNAGILTLRERALYPALYPWLIALAALDVVLTWTVLNMGGHEVNLVARGVIDVAGLPGMILLKLAMLAIILAVCQYVGRRRHAVGRRLAEWAVAANTLAVSLGCLFISQYWYAILISR